MLIPGMALTQTLLRCVQDIKHMLQARKHDILSCTSEKPAQAMPIMGGDHLTHMLLQCLQHTQYALSAHMQDMCQPK